MSRVVGHRWSKSVLKVTDRLTGDFQGNPRAAGQAALRASPAGQEDGRPPFALGCETPWPRHSGSRRCLGVPWLWGSEMQSCRERGTGGMLTRGKPGQHRLWSVRRVPLDGISLLSPRLAQGSKMPSSLLAECSSQPLGKCKRGAGAPTPPLSEMCQTCLFITGTDRALPLRLQPYKCCLRGGCLFGRVIYLFCHASAKADNGVITIQAAFLFCGREVYHPRNCTREDE